MIIRLRQLLLHSLIGSRQENNLAVGRLGHGLHGLEVPDLHGGRGGEDVGGLAHELGGLDLGAGGDDFGLADSLALSGHGERVLQVGAEDDVLDQHALDLHAPPRGDVLDDLADGLGNLFAALDDVLEDARADDVAEGGLCAFDECLADVADAEGCLVGRGDVVVDDRCEVEGYIVFGHADLLWDLYNATMTMVSIGSLAAFLSPEE